LDRIGPREDPFEPLSVPSDPRLDWVGPREERFEPILVPNDPMFDRIDPNSIPKDDRFDENCDRVA
jgi:hypothetical protein